MENVIDQALHVLWDRAKQAGCPIGNEEALRWTLLGILQREGPVSVMQYAHTVKFRKSKKTCIGYV